MAPVLPWVALGLGAIALAHAGSTLMRRPVVEPVPRALLLAAAGVVLLALLATLPASGVWSEGQGLWPGLLLGGATVLLAGLAGARAGVAQVAGMPEPAAGERSGESGRGWLAACAVPAAASACGLALLAGFLPRYLLMPSLGFAAGALLAGLVLAGAGRALAGSERGSTLPVVELGTLVAVAGGVTQFLAVYHRSPAGVREWQPLPALLLATLAAGLSLGALFAPDDSRRGAGRGSWAAVAAGLVPLVAMAALIAYRLDGTPPLLAAVLLGLGAAAVAAWLDAGTPQEGAPRFDLGLLAALVALGAGAVAFRFLHGYGLGVAVIAGSAVAACLSRTHDTGRELRPLVPGVLVVLLLAAVHRAFEERVTYGGGTEPDQFYSYASLVAGALLPAALAGTLRRGSALVPAVSSVALAGLAAAVAPLAVWVLFGSDAQAAFQVGLAVGAGFLLSTAFLARPTAPPSHTPTHPHTHTPIHPHTPALLALAMGLSSVLFTDLLEPLALWSRKQRIGLLLGLFLVAAVWHAVDLWRERRTRR